MKERQNDWVHRSAVLANGFTCMLCCNVEQDREMREMSVREANQNFSQLIAAAERGETIVITKNGTPVAKLSPQGPDRAADPQWRAAFKVLEKSLRSKRAIGYRVGPISEDDKYGGNAG
jgi:prevent-host-death family protein